MEMESLHTPDNIQTAESGPSSKPASYKDAQVWKDIEAETGFASYADYLDYYSGVRPSFEFKREQYQNLPQDEDAMPANKRHRTVIYDLSVQESSLTKLSLRRICDSGTELIQALRKPPDGVCVQLVLWFTSDVSLNQEMADTLVLGLKLNLDDFTSHHFRTPWSSALKKSACQVKSISGEQTVATILQDFMPDVANAIPVVLIASRPEIWEIPDFEFAGGTVGKPPILKTPRQSMPFEDNDHRIWKAVQLFTRAVEHFLMQDTVLHSTKPFLLLAALSPLLYREACRIRDTFNFAQDLYTDIVFVDPDTHGGRNDWQDLLDRQRSKLRRVLEVSEDLLGQFSRYLGSEAHSHLSERSSYGGIVTTLRSLITDARRLDAEIRDFKQARVGALALEESRKAIDLSNAQIREAKSGKSGKAIWAKYADIT